MRAFSFRLDITPGKEMLDSFVIINFSSTSFSVFLVFTNIQSCNCSSLVTSFAANVNMQIHDQNLHLSIYTRYRLYMHEVIMQIYQARRDLHI